MSLDASHVYLAYKSCGCMVGAATDCGDKETAAYVANFIKSGCTVQRMTFEDYRKTAGPLGCKCGPKKPKQGDLFAGMTL